MRNERTGTISKLESQNTPSIMASPMESSNASAASHEHMASLAQNAEQKIFKEMAKHIQNESKQSVFAVGGSIPITSLDDYLICESDDPASEDGN